VLELGGVRDVLTKSIGTQNPINLVKATMQGLHMLRKPEDVAELRGISIREVLGVGPDGNGAPAETVSDQAASDQERAAAAVAPAGAERPAAESAVSDDPEPVPEAPAETAEAADATEQGAAPAPPEETS
jgi:small subunit ribosomal protein S5